MKYLYKIIEHNSYMPAEITTDNKMKYPYHLHGETEILFVLEGWIDITVEQRTTRLHNDQMFVINPNVFHHIHTASKDDKMKLLILQFDLDQLYPSNVELGMLYFEASYNRGLSEQVAYDHIKKKLMSITEVVINREVSNHLFINRCVQELMVILLDSFQGRHTHKIRGQSSEKRMMAILRYVSDNSQHSNLSLEQIAHKFHLNPQYLSRYFKNKMGITLKKFIDNVRLNNSLRTLKLTDERIIDIAFRYGFPDAKAYYRVIKSRTGMTPAEYRTRLHNDVHAVSGFEYCDNDKKFVYSQI